MWIKIEFFILIMIIGMKGFVQGSCLEYGHSCWGAHGKRSAKTATSPAALIENKRYSQNSKDFDSEISIPQRHRLLNILLNKNSFDNIDEYPNNSDHPILITANEIDNRKFPESTRNWNLNKFQLPLRKRIYFRKSIPDNQQQLIPIKSRIQQNNDERDAATFDPYNYLRKSSKPELSEKSYYLQSDIYLDEDQNLQDFPLK